MVVHTCDPRAWRVKGEGQVFKVILGSLLQGQPELHETIFQHCPLPPSPVSWGRTQCWQQYTVVFFSCSFNFSCVCLRNPCVNAWWYMPLVPAPGRQAGRSLRLRPDLHSETLCQKKKAKKEKKGRKKKDRKEKRKSYVFSQLW